jgi:hypothetical protein
MWAGSRFLPRVCGLAAGFYLEYVGWQLCSRSRKDILQISIEALSHLSVLNLTHPVNPSYTVHYRDCLTRLEITDNGSLGMKRD